MARIAGFALVVFLLHSAAAMADGRMPSWVVWRADLVGTIGGKPIRASIARVGDRAKGSYCYGTACNDAAELTLSGTAPNRHIIEMDETSGHDGAAPVTGHWSLTTVDGHVGGFWKSPDGKRRLPIVLRYAHATRDFPFEMVFEASGPCDDITRCDGSVALYQAGRRVQSLAMPTTPDDWDMAAPRIVEMNFDGWPDLLVLDMGNALPNWLYRAWLFDPGRGQMVQVEVPTSPAFDYTSKRVTSFTHDGAGSYTQSVFQWNGVTLDKVAFAESYQMPVRVGDQILYCRMVPEFRDGGIRFPDAPAWRGGRIVFVPNTGAKSPYCAADSMTGLEIRVVILAEHAGRQIVHASEIETWNETATPAGPRYCPTTPVLDGQFIAHVVGTGESCLDQMPNDRPSELEFRPGLEVGSADP